MQFRQQMYVRGVGNLAPAARRRAGPAGRSSLRHIAPLEQCKIFPAERPPDDPVSSPTKDTVIDGTPRYFHPHAKLTVRMGHYVVSLEFKLALVEAAPAAAPVARQFNKDSCQHKQPVQGPIQSRHVIISRLTILLVRAAAAGQVGAQPLRQYPTAKYNAHPMTCV